MSRMVNHLLDLARLEEGSLPLERAPLDLTALLERVAQQLTPQAQAAQVQLEFAAQDNGSLRLVGDDDRLAQVFTNLVDNAIKFTPPGGQVVVRCERSGDRAVVLVQDSGPGIAKGDLERIFERFYQADKARQGGGRRGAGLGLAICREIVEAHGGDLRAENTPQGGALFTVRLPLAKPDDITLAQRP
jgi:signal transduction histidine kinase